VRVVAALGVTHEADRRETRRCNAMQNMPLYWDAGGLEDAYRGTRQKKNVVVRLCAGARGEQSHAWRCVVFRESRTP
jgi:hypothetical protein